MKRDQDNPVLTEEIAIALAKQGKYAEAEKLLVDFVSRMPPQWKPVKENETQLVIAFWDQTEFLNYCFAHEASKDIVAVTPSYSKGYYLLGSLAVEQKDYDKALDYLDRALELEPDHPLILSEKALVLAGQGKLTEAAELYLKAHNARPWADKFHKARALRGAGVCLIDLGKLDQAERLLEISLRLEIGNKLALKELDHIQYLRAGGTPSKGNRINTIYG